MRNKPLPSKERLDELLDFNAETGEIRWKVAKAFNVKSGDIAGSIWTSSSGIKYRTIKIDRSVYKAHRLMYYYFTNQQPYKVDHKNGNGLDNRLINLRVDPYGLNEKNAKKRKDNISGVIGVNKRKDGRWQTQYGSNKFAKDNKTYKKFKTFEEAVAQRKAWEDKYGMTELKKHRRDRV